MKKSEEIYQLLDKNYPEHISFLEYYSSFQLLVSVIMSAQTTDRQVMQVVPELFKKYPDPASLAKANPETVMKIIHSVGFFRVKANNIIKTAEILCKEYNCKVPETIDELIKLPGVGRKSANVVVGALGKPAIIVDTHFGRVVRRLGLTKEENPDKVESDIAKTILPKHQYRFSMSANLHGREICHSRKPECEKCFLNKICDSAFTFK